MSQILMYPAQVNSPTTTISGKELSLTLYCEVG